VSASELDRFTTYLEAEELQRAARFRFPIHRARFIAGRGLLRSILARYLKTDPAEIQFEYSRFGKPELIGGALHFNLAHSEDRVILAISKGPVGVDLEVPRPISDIDSVAAQVFSAYEMAAWRGLGDAELFLRLWTRKEALLKGIGLGIAHHVKEVSVFFGNEANIQVPRALSAEEWTIQTFAAEEDIWSIAAVHSPQCLLSLLRFDRVRTG
jgi:4'-phosphopantetheinyl transferase